MLTGKCKIVTAVQYNYTCTVKFLNTGTDITNQTVLTQIRRIRDAFWARGYKTFFILNLVEHKILNARKYKILTNSVFFAGSDRWRRVFFPFINVKMPAVCWYFNIYEQEKFHAQLSMKKVL